MSAEEEKPPKVEVRLNLSSATARAREERRTGRVWWK